MQQARTCVNILSKLDFKSTSDGSASEVSRGTAVDVDSEAVLLLSKLKGWLKEAQD